MLATEVEGSLFLQRITDGVEGSLCLIGLLVLCVCSRSEIESALCLQQIRDIGQTILLADQR